MEETYFPDDINSRRIGEYRTQITLRPVEGRVGWVRFSLYLKDDKGRIASRRNHSGDLVPAPVLEGIHSRGGKGIKAWIEVESYLPIVRFIDNGSPPKVLDLPGTDQERELLRILADMIPPGGHLMFAYEVPNESAFHGETLAGLLANIPPVCTPLGKLLFDAGFRLVKDWYLAEGGFEGPRKLWGEKPVDDVAERLFDRRTFFQVLDFFSRKPVTDFIDMESAARKRAVQVLADLRLEPPLLELRENVTRLYLECGDSEAMETAARQSCRLVSSLLEAGVEDDAVMTELARIARECSVRYPSGTHS